MIAFQDKIAQVQKRRLRYGAGREIISAEVSGHRFVAVGDELHWAPADNWRTFPDFLAHYIKRTLGGDWGNAEIAKAEEDRHPIIRMYQAAVRSQARHTPDEDGIYRAAPSGPYLAYLTLAYDLYVVRHNVGLQSRLIQRLKKRDQFQGARYELFATATCVRAGFEIDFEDETEGSTRHPEFVGRNRVTGESIAVEAKSRHRAGVLGRPGKASQQDRAGIEGLLEDAFSKPSNHPYVVFVDLNFPPPIDEPGAYRLRDEVDNVLRSRALAFPDEPEPFTVVVCTNHPWHYGGEESVADSQMGFFSSAERPRHTFKSELTLDGLLQAATQHGRIPNEFHD